MIKAYILAATLLIPTLLWSAKYKVEIGDSLEQTIEALGKPVGLIELRDKTLLLFPQGEVTLKDDKISHIDLMSDEQFAADQERLKNEHADWLIQQQRLAAARIEEGKQLKAYKMKSSTFAALPAKDRVDYWRSFQIRYPEVDASTEIARALESYQTEVAELKNQHKIAELETRVAQAEQEAASSRLETEKLRKETEAVTNSEIRLREYYTTPYNYYYRAPRVILNNRNRVIHNNQNVWDLLNWNNNCNTNYRLPVQRSQTNSQNITNLIN